MFSTFGLGLPKLLVHYLTTSLAKRPSKRTPTFETPISKTKHGVWPTAAPSMEMAGELTLSTRCRRMRWSAFRQQKIEPSSSPQLVNGDSKSRFEGWLLENSHSMFESVACYIQSSR
jgi:hypothetical protein